MTSIQRKVRAFSKGTKAHYTNLRNEPVWLLLATFGCWSVNSSAFPIFGGILKIIAMSAVLMFFIERIFRGSALPENTTYSMLISSLVEEISSSNINEKEKNQLLEKVKQTESKYILNISHCRYWFPLALVFVFWVISVFIFANELTHTIMGTEYACLII